MKNRIRKHHVLALIASLALGTAHATLIYQQDFNSLTDGGLDGQAGFTVASGNQTYNVTSGGLSYTSGAVSHGGTGNHLAIVGGSNDNAASVGFTQQTGDLYFSFLFESTNTGVFLWVAASDDADFDNSGGVISGWNSGNLVFGRLRDSTSNEGTSSAGGWAQDNTYLAVGRLTKSAPTGNYDTFSVLLNPDSLTEPALGDWETASLDIDISSVDTLVFRVGSQTNVNYSVDEFRVGTSYDSVVIPEPGTLVLVGLALGSLLLFRRRT